MNADVVTLNNASDYLTTGLVHYPTGK